MVLGTQPLILLMVELWLVSDLIFNLYVGFRIIKAVPLCRIWCSGVFKFMSIQLF
jgi:hypothetical protein